MLLHQPRGKHCHRAVDSIICVAKARRRSLPRKQLTDNWDSRQTLHPASHWPYPPFNAPLSREGQGALLCAPELGQRFCNAMPSEGLYSNIRKRRAAGKKPRKASSKLAPSAQDFKNAARTAKPKPKSRKPKA